MDLKSALWELQRIISADGSHNILNVSVNADAKTINRAYRNLCRHVHPNNGRILRHFQEHPDYEVKFTKAFQKVLDAYGTLKKNLNSNESNLRHSYSSDDDNDDGSGDDNNGGSGEDNNGGNYGSEDENKGARDYYSNNRNGVRSDGHIHWWETLIGCNIFGWSPVVLLIIFPLVASVLYITVASLFAPNPIFRLKRDSEYVTKYQTEFGKIQYFVQNDARFRVKYQERYGSWNELEWDVITAYEHKMHVKCNRERNKDKLLEEARISGNRKTYMEATSKGTPSCDKRQKIATWKQSNPLHWKKWNSFLKFLNLS
ncbi:uncharacterized protein LOC119066590 [Bradysia coprophila]|uniref:uncharacterized protein LOC119066590 n=1 Tax=Bradysia coprophila TaxID=38358 RepID=UPI00187D7A48|nr:uncharacterized protein LOC119066590 [Bradysia coprophila]